MKKYFLLMFLLLGMTSSNQLYAEINLTDDDGEKKFQIGGNGSIMFGQLANGYKYGDNLAEKHWQYFYSGRVDMTSTPTEWFKTKLSLEITSGWPVEFESNIMKSLMTEAFKPNLPQAVGIFNFDFDFMTLMIESGMMEYAFNNQVKNLGNYLYRSQAYPFYLTTELDYIYSNLVGFRFETGFLEDNLKVGAMMNSTISKPPFFDINLGLFASYTMPNKLFDFGFGIVFDRLIAMDPEETDFEGRKNILVDSTIGLRATKLDLRVTLDPKVFFPDLDIFGENDLIIYGEAAILGTKDPDYYPIDPEYPSEDDDLYPRPNLIHRMPIMFGLNIPTFKVLDYLTFEIEFCKYPYPFDWAGTGGLVISPNTVMPTGEKIELYRNRDNIKWSLYAKKSISNFDFITIFANDHKTYISHNAESASYTEQSLRRNWDWHWYVKLQYNL